MIEALEDIVKEALREVVVTLLLDILEKDIVTKGEFLDLRTNVQIIIKTQPGVEIILHMSCIIKYSKR